MILARKARAVLRWASWMLGAVGVAVLWFIHRAGVGVQKSYLEPTVVTVLIACFAVSIWLGMSERDE